MFYENLIFFWQFAIGHNIGTHNGFMANECWKSFQ